MILNWRKNFWTQSLQTIVKTRTTVLNFGKAVAQANPNAYTQLSNCHRNKFGKRVCEFEPSSNLLHGIDESVHLNPDDILYAPFLTDEFANKISLRELRMGSSTARTIVTFENGPSNEPAASLEEMLTHFESFGERNITGENSNNEIFKVTGERAPTEEANEQCNVVEDEAYCREEFEKLA